MIRNRSRPSHRSALRVSTLVAAGGLIAVVVAGFFGAYIPLFDTMAQFRAHVSIALAAAALLLFAMRLGSFALAAVATAALGLYSVMPFMLPAQPAGVAPLGLPRYTLLQMNLRFDAPDPGAALSRIGAVRPDVVTVQEVTPAWQDTLERLRPTYPFQFYCASPHSESNTAILSRRPFVTRDPGGLRRNEICDIENGFAAKRIDFNGLPMLVASEHLRWPWPWRQNRMVAALFPSLGTLDDPLIVAGDFNCVPWAAALRRYAEASRTRILAGIGPTWLSRLLPQSLARFAGLPIDNVLVSDGVEVLAVERLEPTSSDHLPVLVTFTMHFAVPDEPEVRSARR